MEFDITYDQTVFFSEHAATDWGILINLWQGDPLICICAMKREEVIKILEGALEAMKRSPA